MAQLALIAGTAISAAGALESGRAAQSNANFQAAQMTQQAAQERAAGSRAAAEEARRKRLIQSRAMAVGAASGGGVDYRGIGEIEEEGEMRVLSALYEGEERGRGMDVGAAGKRFGGKAARAASQYRAVGTVLDGAASFYEKYG